MDKVPLLNQESSTSPAELKIRDFITPALVLLIIFFTLQLFISLVPFRYLDDVFELAFIQIIFLLPTVLAIALTSNKKIPDLTYFSTFIFSQSVIQAFSSPAVGIIVSILLCTAIGCVNGILLSKIKLPSIYIIIGLAVILLLIGIFILNNYNQKPFDETYFSFKPIWLSIGFASLALSSVLAFMKRIWRSDSPGHQNSTILIYAISSLFATLNGIGYLVLMRYTPLYFNTLYSNKMLLLMVFSVSVIISSLLYKRVVPAVFSSIIIAICFELVSTLLSVISANSIIFTVLIASISAIFFIVRLIINRKNRPHCA